MGLIQVQAKRRQSMAAITRRGERKESKVLSWAVVWWLWAWEKRKEIKINKECRKTKRKRANKIGSGVWWSHVAHHQWLGRGEGGRGRERGEVEGLLSLSLISLFLMRCHVRVLTPSVPYYPGESVSYALFTVYKTPYPSLYTFSLFILFFELGLFLLFLSILSIFIFIFFSCLRFFSLFLVSLSLSSLPFLCFAIP